MLENGGIYTRDYIVTLDDGHKTRSTITVVYTNSNEKVADDYSGSRTAPAIGSSITIYWDYESDSFLGGSFYWTVTIKRTGTNSIKGTDCSISVVPPQLCSLDSKEVYFAEQVNDFAVRCKGSFVTKALDLVHTVYTLTADFVIEDGEIGFMFWYK